MAEDKERLAFAKLPPVAELEDKTRQRVIALMEKLDEVVMEKVQLSVQEDEIKDELEQLQKKSGKTGFRHGWLCFAAQEVAGRKTLDKMLLLENGCPASALNASYVTGKPSIRATFKRLTEEE